jgi:hypothetical protein
MAANMGKEHYRHRHKRSYADSTDLFRCSGGRSAPPHSRFTAVCPKAVASQARSISMRSCKRLGPKYNRASEPAKLLFAHFEHKPPPPINPLHEQSPSCESFAAKPLVANHSHLRAISSTPAAVIAVTHVPILDGVLRPVEPAKPLISIAMRALHGPSSSPHPGPAGRAILPRKLSPVPGLHWGLLWRICHTSHPMPLGTH